MSEASNVIVLDPDVADAFPNGQAVNAALRSLLELAKLAARAVPPTANTGQSPRLADKGQREHGTRIAAPAGTRAKTPG